MKRSFVVAVLTVLLSVTSVSALNNRSAVSINGLDTNPCTTTLPCRSFGVAIAQTNPGGEVVALDTAGYGPFTVSTAMTISGAPGVHAAITATSGDAITVNAAGTDMVTLRNLMLIGTGIQSGISDFGSGETRVLNCTITGFHSDGIFADNGRLTVDHCSIFDSDDAIVLQGQFSSVAAVITNSLIETYTSGLLAISAATAMVRDCTFVGGSSVGVGALSIFGIGSVPTRVVIETSTLAYNTTAIQVTTSGNNTAVVYIAQDDIAYSTTGVQATGGGVVMSYGNNRFAEVTTIGPLGVIGLQ
jgi:hypothetical protein